MSPGEGGGGAGGVCSSSLTIDQAGRGGGLGMVEFVVRIDGSQPGAVGGAGGAGGAGGSRGARGAGGSGGERGCYGEGFDEFGNRITGGGYDEFGNKVTGGGYDASGNKVSKGVYDEFGNKVTGGGYDASGNKVTGGGYDEFGNKVTGNKVTGGGYDEFGNKVTGGGYDASGNKVTGGGYDEFGNKVTGGGYDASGNKVTGGGYDEFGNKFTGGGDNTDGSVRRKAHGSDSAKTTSQLSTAGDGFDELGELDIHGIRRKSHEGTNFGIATERKTAETEQLSSAESEEKRTFEIRAVVNPLDQTEISLQQAILLGIIRPIDGTYVNSVTGQAIPLGAAMSEGLVKVCSCIWPAFILNDLLKFTQYTIC